MATHCITIWFRSIDIVRYFLQEIVQSIRQFQWRCKLNMCLPLIYRACHGTGQIYLKKYHTICVKIRVLNIA